MDPYRGSARKALFRPPQKKIKKLYTKGLTPRRQIGYPVRHMNAIPLTYANKRLGILLTISLFTVALLLSPQSLRAQDVIGVSATGGEPQTGDGATATGAWSLAGGTNATAGAVGAIALGGGPSAAMAPAATGLFSTAIGSGGAIDRGALASGEGSIAIGGVENPGGTTGATASGLGSIAIGNRSVASATNTVAMGVLATATTADATAIGSGAQAGAGGGSATAIGAHAIASGAEGATAVGANTVASGDDAVAIGGSQGSASAAANATAGGAVAVGVQTDATGTSSFAGAAFAQATGTSSVAIGGGGFGSGTTGAVASGLHAVALGASTSATFSNSTAIGFGATTTRANQMSFGTATNTYTMAGITSGASTAAQSGPTEFVTTDLNGNLAAFDLGPTFSAINTRINRAFNRIDHTRNEAEGGVALAMAAGQIRYDDRAGKLSVGGGLGGFEHEGGGAVGIGYTAPNERVRVNFAAGGSTHGDFGCGGGLSITLN